MYKNQNDSKKAVICESLSTLASDGFCTSDESLRLLTFKGSFVVVSTASLSRFSFDRQTWCRTSCKNLRKRPVFQDLEKPKCNVAKRRG